VSLPLLHLTLGLRKRTGGAALPSSGTEVVIAWSVFQHTAAKGGSACSPLQHPVRGPQAFARRSHTPEKAPETLAARSRSRSGWRKRRHLSPRSGAKKCKRLLGTPRPAAVERKRLLAAPSTAAAERKSSIDVATRGRGRITTSMSHQGASRDFTRQFTNAFLAAGVLVNRLTKAQCPPGVLLNRSANGPGAKGGRGRRFANGRFGSGTKGKRFANAHLYPLSRTIISRTPARYREIGARSTRTCGRSREIQATASRTSSQAREHDANASRMRSLARQVKMPQASGQGLESPEAEGIEEEVVFVVARALFPQHQK
jgi:hypothetical protein